MDPLDDRLFLDRSQLAEHTEAGDAEVGQRQPIRVYTLVRFLPATARAPGD